MFAVRHFIHVVHRKHRLKAEEQPAKRSEKKQSFGWEIRLAYMSFRNIILLLHKQHFGSNQKPGRVAQYSRKKDAEKSPGSRIALANND